ncbi:nucleotidyl transferase AbiEii/AbiGii toxin family protein [Streptomyces sp. WMMC500]|uniref:nucleotidyl transferase AbiEii/AbiGii toxin family protein n=1 Tax=Streptomyces sp. WMMC500 TaxID=3015154 RepID=UPI00248BB8A4|nr:nucleotidyl transferase AbiEii/AbiGii toxin family protein [Streptomyces sp. WMMC500]WBB61928.1 nucleotidyl transferase AbiEii/AbiGii toxin family protein [Streptomyces sp. WMMC500]
MSLESLPASHARALRDGSTVLERLGLLIAGGYALRAHQVISRPSQDLDLATSAAQPLTHIADELAGAYRDAGYQVSILEGSERSVRMLLTLPDGIEQLEVDLLKEALSPNHLAITGPSGEHLQAISFDDAVGLKVRALHDRSYPAT